MAEVRPGKTNLEAWWELNEESGTRVDAHGSNDLADNNTVLYDTLVKGNAADFEKGNSESLSIADNASLSVADVDFMFTTWLKPESIPGADQDMIIAKGGGVGTREYQAYITTTGSLAWVIYSSGEAGNTVVNSGAGTIIAGTKVFVVIKYDAGASELSVSLDAGSFTTAGSAVTPYDGSSIFRLGGRYAAIDSPYDGLMDETNFWKGILTQDEINWLYNSGDGRAYSDFHPTPSIIAGVIAVIDPEIGTYDTRFKMRARKRDTALTARVRNE